MRSPTARPAPSSRDESGAPAAKAPAANARIAGAPPRAARGPSVEPVSAADNPAPGPMSDTAAQARGRRTLSTAFVRIGAGGTLTIERSDGRILVLRDVVMRPARYCGTHAAGESRGREYCGGYAEVVSARATGSAG